MKYLITLLIILTASLTPALAQHEGHNPSNHDEYSDEKKPDIHPGRIDSDGQRVIVEVHGLVCDFCAQSIEKVFMRRGEVAGINVDLSNKNITIALKEGSTLDDATITQLITDSGYNVASITRKPGGD